MLKAKLLHRPLIIPAVFRICILSLFLAPVDGSCACAGDQTRTHTVFIAARSRFACGDRTNWTPAPPRALEAVSGHLRALPPAFTSSSSVLCPPHENTSSLLWGVCARRQDSLFHGCYSGLFHYLSDTPTTRFIQSETEMYPSLRSSVFPPGSNIRRSRKVSQGIKKNRGACLVVGPQSDRLVRGGGGVTRTVHAIRTGGRIILCK